MTDKENLLKERLIRISSNDHLLEKNEDYYLMGLEMLENIGSLDSELRDDLIYSTLFYWVSKNRFTFEELKNLLNISLDEEHLFYKLGDKDEDAVFKRTFSALNVALIINKHREENFLSDELLYEVKDTLVEYMINEQDVRGYVEIKGWAHSAAHTADALDELVQCTCFRAADLMDILNTIKAKVCIGYYVYIDEESERMVTPVENALNRRLLSDLEIIKWLQGFKVKNPEGNHIEKFHLMVNIKGFLRSLYFRLLEQEDSIFIVQEIKKVLSNL
ncbi:MAG: hypothetical protein K0R09_1979 [Clostridiales bacterium]|jgi:hypothetical protein|nr:hypothetical protein [Clostridiales bacterium]